MKIPSKYTFPMFFYVSERNLGELLLPCDCMHAPQTSTPPPTSLSPFYLEITFGSPELANDFPVHMGGGSQ